MTRSPTTLAAVFLLAAPAPAQAVPAADKSRYSIANPTPPELRRPLSADRPDFTESPYTVDAGAVQIETSIVEYARNGHADAWTFAATNLKVGLTNTADIQFVFVPYTRVDDGQTTRDGAADTQLRLKINLLGNDEGRIALGLMPFLQLPTAADGLGTDRVEGGLIIPVAIDLTERLGLGLMVEADFVRTPDDDAYDIEFIGSAVLGVDITERAGAYVEGIVIDSRERDAQSILGLGCTYALRENLLLDAGVNLGLAGDADDVQVFTGFTVRY